MRPVSILTTLMIAGALAVAPRAEAREFEIESSWTSPARVSMGSGAGPRYLHTDEGWLITGRVELFKFSGRHGRVISLASAEVGRWGESDLAAARWAAARIGARWEPFPTAVRPWIGFEHGYAAYGEERGSRNPAFALALRNAIGVDVALSSASALGVSASWDNAVLPSPHVRDFRWARVGVKLVVAR